MKAFYGPYRKLVLLPVVTFALGWLTYLSGFIILMYNEDHSSPVANLDHVPHYVVTTCGPFLVVLAVLHAAVLPSFISALLGFFGAILSVINFSCAGYVLYSSGLSIFESGEEANIDIKFMLIFVGCILTGVSWTFILMLWNCFTYKRLSNSHINDDYVIDEEGNMATPPEVPKDPPLLAGVARKVAIVFLVLQTGCWCFFISGVDAEVHNGTLVEKDGFEELSLHFSTWIASTVGALLIIAAVMHAGATGGASTAMGVFTSLLSMLFLTCMGYIVNDHAASVYQECYGTTLRCFISEIPKYILYQLCGGLGTCVLWACVLALWPFYYKADENIGELRRKRRQQRNYLLRIQEQPSHERIPLLSDEDKPSTPTL